MSVAFEYGRIFVHNDFLAKENSRLKQRAAELQKTKLHVQRDKLFGDPKIGKAVKLLNQLKETVEDLDEQFNSFVIKVKNVEETIGWDRDDPNSSNVDEKQAKNISVSVESEDVSEFETAFIGLDCKDLLSPTDVCAKIVTNCTNKPLISQVVRQENKENVPPRVVNSKNSSKKKSALAFGMKSLAPRTGVKVRIGNTMVSRRQSWQFAFEPAKSSTNGSKAQSSTTDGKAKTPSNSSVYDFDPLQEDVTLEIGPNKMLRGKANRANVQMIG